MTEAAGGSSQSARSLAPHDDTEVEQFSVVVIGAGISGILAGIKLLDLGITSFVILERAGDLGGTWRDNTYPGVSCDVATHLYVYSFLPNPSWRSPPRSST